MNNVSLLTPRESEIAWLVAKGACNKRIAEELSISDHTVKAHLSTIFRKMAVMNRLELAICLNKTLENPDT